MPKVYVDTKNLSREELEQLLIDKEQENKKLQEKVNTYSEEYGKLREENKKLKAELERYKKQYEHTMGEDS